MVNLNLYILCRNENIFKLPKYIGEDSNQLKLLTAMTRTSASEGYVDLDYQIYTDFTIYTLDYTSLFYRGSSVFGTYMPILIDPTEEVLSLISLLGIDMFNLDKSSSLYRFFSKQL